jgi:hypothetical protein
MIARLVQTLIRVTLGAKLMVDRLEQAVLAYPGIAEA